MADDVFDGPTEPVVDDSKDYLTELVGEGKKYATQQDLAKAAVHKDQFIEQIKRENAEMREALLKRTNEEEFLSKLEKLAQPKSPEPQDTPVRRDDVKPAITPDDVERIIEQREAKRKRDENLSAVMSRLQDVYGDQYRSRVQSQAQQLGVGTDFLTDVASKNPQAFYKLLGLDQQRKQDDVFSPPPRSQVNTGTSPPSNRKDYQYFQNLRREKGDGWYFSQATQQEIWRAAKDAEKRGEQFLPE